MKLRFYLIRILLSDWKSRRFEDKAGMESQQQQMWSADSLYIATLHKCDFSSGIRWITDCKYLWLHTKMCFRTFKMDEAMSLNFKS